MWLRFDCFFLAKHISIHVSRSLTWKVFLTVSQQRFHQQTLIVILIKAAFSYFERINCSFTASKPILRSKPILFYYVKALALLNNFQVC